MTRLDPCGVPPAVARLTRCVFTNPWSPFLKWSSACRFRGVVIGGVLIHVRVPRAVAPTQTEAGKSTIARWPVLVDTKRPLNFVDVYRAPDLVTAPLMIGHLSSPAARLEALSASTARAPPSPRIESGPDVRRRPATR